MRLSIFSAFLTAASLAQYACANPMRIVVVTGGQLSSPTVRLGHPAVADVAVPPSLGETLPLPEINEAGPQAIRQGRRPCHAAFRDRFQQISDTVRQALGLAPSQVSPVAPGVVHILPFFPEGTPPPGVEPEGPEHHRHRHHHHMHKNSKPFLRRIHHALMVLGPWEGRAVAFVLGCGIGVLLRMLFVMTIITYRLFRGERRENTQYITVVYDHYDDTEEAVVPPPPQYIIDEKVAIDSKHADEA